ncbi:MAG: hypothetical protein HGA85_05720 [Nanoarchaeota archaeon]|nr:hypothetical protein [Nanoarchaeota archaeon]
MKKLLIIFLALVITGCTLFEGSKGPDLPAKISQYPTDAEAGSSYGGMGGNRDDYSAYAATGSPDVTECGDNPRAWTPDGDQVSTEWLELEYFDELYVSDIIIRETFGPGSVVKVEGLNGEEWTVLWEGTYKTKLCPYELVLPVKSLQENITVNMSTFKTDKLRVTLDTDKVQGWNEIDSVEMKGYHTRWYVLNDTLVTE